ncbi:hypothetical protein PG990_007521 [Apiospora arundinis]
MRPLLRKSRSGCSTCRQRRVKCDEVRPVCGNCAKRFITHSPCEYGQCVARRSTRQKGQAQSATRTSPGHSADTRLGRSPTLTPSSIDNGSRWRMLELRLMHHYTTVVCQTMPDCNGSPARYMWEQTIPQYAFTSEVVLNPMLSVAALHMKCHSASDSQLSLAITRYLDRSLVHHRQALKHIDSDIAEPIWLSTVVLANLYWLISHHARPDETYELPLEAWDILAGVSRLYAHRLDLLTKLGYGWFGYDIVPSTLPDEELGPGHRASLQALDEDMSTLLARFDVNATAFDATSQEEHKMYEDAKAYVLLYYRAYFSGSVAKTIRRYIGTMALMFGPAYHQRMRDRDPLAMALYARMLVLMKVLDFAWWMNGSGEYEVMERDVYGMEQLIPTHRRWCMDWPLKVLSGEIRLPPPVKEVSVL